MKRKSRKRKNRLWKVILILSLTGCVCCLGAVTWYLYRNGRTEQEYEAVRQEVAEEPVESLEFTGELEGEEAELPDGIFLDMENPVDFQELQKINPELYAWIRIPDTAIDYPVAQRAGDDGYYLSHDLYGQPRAAGCIYTEDCNSKAFTDPNTVVYGHNMKNGSMFQNLHLFADDAFFQEHPYVYIYTPDTVFVYEVFAAYTYDDRHLINSFDFADRQVFEKYLEDIWDVRAMDKNLRESTAVSGDDRILTLSTCTGGQTQSRYLVQAVLIREEGSRQAAEE